MAAVALAIHCSSWGLSTTSCLQGNVDGAYFGTTFPHLLLMTYPTMRPAKQTETYTPRVFGFKLHPTCVASTHPSGNAAGPTAAAPAPVNHTRHGNLQVGSHLHVLLPGTLAGRLQLLSHSCLTFGAGQHPARHADRKYGCYRQAVCIHLPVSCGDFLSPHMSLELNLCSHAPSAVPSVRRVSLWCFAGWLCRGWEHSHA